MKIDDTLVTDMLLQKNAYQIFIKIVCTSVQSMVHRLSRP